LPICPYCNEEYEGDWIVHAETCPNLPEKYRERLRIQKSTELIKGVPSKSFSKVFIVVTGNIHDPATWGIEKVFRNRARAEEFKRKYLEENKDWFKEGWIIRIEERRVE